MLYALPAPPTRSAAGVAPTRPGTRSRPSAALGGETLVPARRPRPRPPPRAHGGAAPRASRSRSSPRGSPRLGVERGAAPGDRRPAPHARSRTPAGDARLPGRGSSRAAIATRSTRSLRGRARPRARARGARGARAADLIAIAPSNPYVSIGPILAVADPRALERRAGPVPSRSARSIGGRAVKGPADPMLARLAGGTSPAHVAACYEGLIDALVVDEADAATPTGRGAARSSPGR